MIQGFEQFKDSFSKNKTNIKNRKMNNIIQKYHFFLWSDADVKNYFVPSDVDSKDFFFSDVCNLKLITIDQYEENNIKYFIIGQERTIIILDHSSISLLNNYLSKSSDYKACFLSNTDIIFSPLIQNNNKKVKVNSFFQEEINSFNKELDLNEKSKINDIWKIIKPSISGYLIQKGYQRSNYEREYNFQYLYGHDIFSISKMPKIDLIEEDDYIVLRDLGISNFAVRLIYHIETGLLCAQKKDQSDYYLNSFLRKREKTNYSVFEHPFIPKLIGTNKSQDNIFIEFINGQKLDQIEGLTIKQKIDIIFELMIVIEYIHRKHYIYRDIKPDNIIIDENKTAVLIDFDRMRSVDGISDDSVFSTNFGSTYAQPEQLTIEHAYKGDIYSLGRVIYFIMNENFKNYPKMEEIYENCTKINPEERPTIQELILDFYFEFHPQVLIYEITEKYFSEVYNKGVAKVMSMMKLTDFDPFYIYKFGLMFYEGIYITKNIEKYIYYLDIAANYGCDEARFTLGDIYYQGKEVKQNIQKTIYYYSLNHRKNHHHQNFILGTIYYDNKYIPTDIEKAIYYFKLAAKKKHDIACVYLAEIYFDEKYNKHDINKTVYYLQVAANNGFIDAQLYLFTILYNGKKVPQNIDMAIYYLQLAVEKNDPKAQYFLGRIYYEDEVKKDLNKAIYYLVLSAKQNNSDALTTLGIIFSNGEEVKKDMNKAIEYFTLAANNNNAQAQFELGKIYYEGYEVKKDIKKAILYFNLAASEYVEEANFNLGLIYHVENENVRDLQKAIHHYKIAAKYNNCIALNNLGVIYNINLKDKNLAIFYFEQAAKQNYVLSLLNIGLIYINDLNDIEKGFEYLTLALNQNHPETEFCLGLLYLQGRFIKKHYNIALKYFVNAANHGNANAQMILGIIYFCGIFGTFDIPKSFEYFDLSSKKSKESQFYLGLFYFYGIHVKKNIKIALRYFVESSNNHFCYAYFMAGFTYHILNDIKNAIHYYKESSSLGNCFAKNNLGIIYKKSEQYRNINHAIIYFQEAIKEAKDLIPLYNLANLYFFCDEIDNNIIKSIELLVKCKHRNAYIDRLLCLASIMEFGFEIDDIKEELNKYDKNVSKQICEVIKKEHLNDSDVFELLYQLHKENDLLYAFETPHHCIFENSCKIYIQTKDVDESFYEGFGIKI